MDEENLYRAPEGEVLDGSGVPVAGNGGIGRLLYFFSLLGCFVVGPLVFAIFFLRFFDVYQLGSSLGFFFWYLVAPVVPTFYRLRNIGGNPWASLFVLIPVGNVLMMTFGVSAPPGFAEHKKWDGYSLAAGVFCLILFVMFAAVVF